jgi:hypothetical protein
MKTLKKGHGIKNTLVLPYNEKSPLILAII